MSKAEKRETQEFSRSVRAELSIIRLGQMGQLTDEDLCYLS